MKIKEKLRYLLFGKKLVLDTGITEEIQAYVMQVGPENGNGQFCKPIRCPDLTFDLTVP